MSTKASSINVSASQYKSNVDKLPHFKYVDSESDSEYTVNEWSLDYTSTKKTGKQVSKKTLKSSHKFTRKIKDQVQMQYLEEFFKLDPEWSKSTIQFISGFMSLTPLQLYKWGYDQKRKNSCKKGIRTKIRENLRLSSNEEFTDYNLIVDQLFPEIESKSTSNTFKNQILFEKLRDRFFNRSENLSTLEEDSQTPIKAQENDNNELVLHFDSDINLEMFNIVPEFNIKVINSFNNLRDVEDNTFFFDPKSRYCYNN